MITMQEIKKNINKLQSTRKSLQEQKRALQAAIAEEQQELGRLSAMPVTMQDHRDHFRERVAYWDKALRENIRNHLTNTARPYNNPGATREVKDLSTYLSRFGQNRSEEGRQPYIPYVMAAGSWANLAKIVTEELEMIDKNQWGPLPAKVRNRKTAQCRARIEELKKALAELEPHA